jgi:hypothetical protein
MSCFSSTRQARIRERLAQIEQQLTVANETYSELLAESAESYKFDSGEGSQHVKRRSLDELKKQIDSLLNERELLLRKLECGGIVNLNLRRKVY